MESKTPKFTKSDLRMTRLKNPQKGQLLIFKELEWQTVRIEAKSTIDKNLTPLRLLTNQARCRIVIKKRLSGKYDNFFSLKFQQINYYNIIICGKIIR